MKWHAIFLLIMSTPLYLTVLIAPFTEETRNNGVSKTWIASFIILTLITAYSIKVLWG